MSIVDKYAIREMNEKSVLRSIIQEESISRADIAKLLNLNKTSVSSIVGDLLERDLIIEIGSGQSSGGRKPTILTFNKKAGLSLSFDIGPHNITSILTYLDGEFVADKYTSIQHLCAETILETLKKDIEGYVHNLKPSTYGIVGICIGIHGIVNENKVIFSPFYSFDQIDLKTELEAMFGIPVLLENEANLAALGEHQHTTPKTNLISVSVKHGIGAGTIANGNLHTGTSGHSGEIGHLITVIDGHQCPCGNQGCLELYASEYHILQGYKEASNLESVSFTKFKKDYFSNNPEAKKWMAQFVQYMAIAVNNLITTFNPEVIIINSRFTNQIDDITDQIKEKITYKGKGKTVIKASTLDREATLLGGAHLNTTQFLGI
ncbi:MAG: ROK family transcriptional regulator [Turicibacter sp.]|nr:ROK family transcriptional regulator [Turicibacter sp.]